MSQSSGSDQNGPFVSWEHNNGTAAPRPPDAEEWREIIAGIGRLARVVLVERRGGWFLAVAEDPPPPSVGSTIETTPIDLRNQVLAALVARGKPVTA